ncbi:hypothetical protein AVEN_55263-1, partial [Araneus ventricosus]
MEGTLTATPHYLALATWLRSVYQLLHFSLITCISFGVAIDGHSFGDLIK